MARAAAAAAAQQTQPAAPAVKTSRASRSFVTVACKLGIPSFELQLCRPNKVMEQSQTGPREVTLWTPVNGVVRIRGTAYPRGTPPAGFPDRPEMAGGFALTRGVPKDFFDEWMKQHSKDACVISGMIFGGENHDQVVASCKENADLLSGLEPLVPDKDNRLPKSTRADLTSIETEESRRASVEKAVAASAGA